MTHLACNLVLILLIACSHDAAASAIHDALAIDGECDASHKDCAVSALQLLSNTVEPVELLSMRASDEELAQWHNKWYGRTAGADISMASYKSLMSNISAQQKLVQGLWNESVELEKQVDPLVKQVEQASGLKVADFVSLMEEGAEFQARSETGSQPREAHTKKWLSYLEQEMSMVFKKLNVVDKKNAACGTLMSKNPMPLALRSGAAASLLLTMASPDTQILPGDHSGVSDELWRSLLSIISNIHTASASAANLKMHIINIDKMIEDFNAGKLIPNKKPGSQ